MSRSIPAGGQITPLERASLSLSCSEPPLPTVGGSVLTSGGQVTPCCAGDCASPAGCADTVPGEMLANIAMIKAVGRKSEVLAGLQSMRNQRASRRDVPAWGVRDRDQRDPPAGNAPPNAVPFLPAATPTS
jgi:hypothetical protein